MSLALFPRTGNSLLQRSLALLAPASCRWASTQPGDTQRTSQRVNFASPIRGPSNASARTKALAKRTARTTHRSQIAEDMKNQNEGRILERFQTREWAPGDIYSPHDLSPSEMKKWSKRWSPSNDAFDALNIKPLEHYKNFSIMSEYMTPMGRIKHRSATGLRPVNQRKIAKAIRRAIGVGLMPSVHQHPEIIAMELKEQIWAPSPSTERGLPTQLSSDPKGEKLAYASNKSIFIRSIDDPAIARQYTEHTAQATVARFSPSGFYVASGDVTGTVKVWDCVGDGLTKGSYQIINGRINDIAWDGDSQRIVAVGDGRQRYGHFFTWDSGNTVGEIYGHTRAINSVSIRQQRPLRAAAAGDDTSLVFYHGAPFKFNTAIRGKHNKFIYGTAFSPDGSQLVSVGADSRIWLYDGKTGEPTTSIGENEHKGSIFGVSWSKDSRKFATASADRTVKLWDVEAGKATQTWTLNDGGAVSYLNQQVGVVIPSGRTDGLVISLSLSGNLNYLVEGSPEPRQVLKSHQKNITSLTHFSPADGQETLWTGSSDGRVCSWDVAKGVADTIDGENHTNYIAGLTSSQEGKGRIYSVGWDDTLRSADVAANTYTRISTKLSVQPKGVATAGKLVLVAGSEQIDIYQDSNKTGTFKAPADITAIAARENTVAFSGADLNTRVGTVTSSAISISPQVQIKKLRSQISALSFSPDGTLLAVGDSMGKIFVFKTSDGSLVTDRWSSHTSRITSLAWNSKGTHLVSGALDTHIYIWSLARPGDWIEAKNVHKEGVTGVAWIANETKIASAGTDAAIKIWKVESLP
ncbi:hypothetical protein ZTR_03582 [Talaromyces verruculosus]|nr:hypothetical protein ZTR_03582 [Talaromyces verruculosus]